jgi:hypothetical protein
VDLPSCTELSDAIDRLGWFGTELPPEEWGLRQENDEGAGVDVPALGPAAQGGCDGMPRWTEDWSVSVGRRVAPSPGGASHFRGRNEDGRQIFRAHAATRQEAWLKAYREVCSRAGVAPKW